MMFIPALAISIGCIATAVVGLCSERIKPLFFRSRGKGEEDELRSGEASKLGCGAREAFGPLGNCVVSALVTELSAERSRE